MDAYGGRVPIASYALPPATFSPTPANPYPAGYIPGPFAPIGFQNLNPNAPTAQGVIHVFLPTKDAVVYLNGQKMRGTGKDRKFTTPVLQANQEYQYWVTATFRPEWRERDPVSQGGRGSGRVYRGRLHQAAGGEPDQVARRSRESERSVSRATAIDCAERNDDMDDVPPNDQPPMSPANRRRLWRRVVVPAIGLLLLYLFVAYIVVPAGWMRYTHRHPALDDVPDITHTADGIPGDPLNVALVGTEAEVKAIMAAAKWYLANPLGLRSDLEIAADTVLKRPDDRAPVSNLYLFGRKEDLAFEQPVGDNPRQRHHVRFWRAEKVAPDGRPVWVGSAVYDERVGLSRTTGQITHVTAPDIDAERDYLFKCLEKTGDLAETYYVDNFHKLRKGRNGGGDPWETDGRLCVGIILPEKQTNEVK